MKDRIIYMLASICLLTILVGCQRQEIKPPAPTAAEQPATLPATVLLRTLPEGGMVRVKGRDLQVPDGARIQLEAGQFTFESMQQDFHRQRSPEKGVYRTEDARGRI